MQDGGSVLKHIILTVPHACPAGKSKVGDPGCDSYATVAARKVKEYLQEKFQGMASISLHVPVVPLRDRSVRDFNRRSTDAHPWRRHVRSAITTAVDAGSTSRQATVLVLDIHSFLVVGAGEPIPTTTQSGGKVWQDRRLVILDGAEHPVPSYAHQFADQVGPGNAFLVDAGGRNAIIWQARELGAMSLLLEFRESGPEEFLAGTARMVANAVWELRNSLPMRGNLPRLSRPRWST